MQTLRYTFISISYFSGNKRYDIYVSYQASNNNDKQFAELHLIPFLKRKGYTVCATSTNAFCGAGNIIIYAETEGMYDFRVQQASRKLH